MDRRSFITRAGLLTGSLAISLKSDVFALKRGESISGQVRSGRKGLASAVVSDGYSVVKTDKQGRYALTPHPKAKFVWLSTPAGYEFNHENSVARHYHRLGVRQEYDFNLKKLSKNDDRHQFVIWADTQVRIKADVEKLMATAVPDLQQYVASLPAGTLIHGIGVGDLVWDDLSFFNDYSAAVGRVGIPFFQVLGNHDQDYNKGGDDTADGTFHDVYGPTWYSFNRGRVHYVVMDDVRYLGKDRQYDGYISEAQLDWLKKDLEHVPKNHLLIINVHIPIHNSVKNNGEFYNVVKDFANVHVMSGHTHYNTNVITSNVYEHNHGTVCGAWWTGPICEDGTPNGYGVYEVNGTELKWQYKSTGYPLEKQLSLNLETLTNQKRMIANVWNYDPSWKVEYYLDGVSKGALEPQKGYDPLAVSLMKGPDLPKGRTFPEPKLTAHIFAAQFANTVKQVRVVATDRFGRKYEVTESFS